ncbi:NAD(P)-dependent oxidoreductase [Pseudomonas putida]|uniref:NAD(P)-dependent oxidoreductase n=1 Tax=Pseudomonas putida TaxID=303 RepID=A0A4D6XAD6_PSEPU|nr:NAD(P)-dependent oxidoreductase [Pseudomonas putida]
MHVPTNNNSEDLLVKVFITGASGRVGSQVAKALMGRGHSISTVVLPGDPNLSTAQAAGIECITGDLADRNCVAQAMEGAEAVFHLAALISFRAEDRDRLWQANVTGSYNVFDCAARQSAQHPVRLIFASSDQVYPTRFARYRPVDENHPREPYSFYGMTKLLGQDLLDFFARTNPNLKVSTAIFSHIEAAAEVIDPKGEYSRPAFSLQGRIDSLRAASSHNANSAASDVQRLLEILEPLAADDDPLLIARDANGNAHTQELTDVRDIVDALLLMLDKPTAIGETFNLAPPSLVGLDTFIPYLAKATGRRYVEAKLPAELGQPHSTAAKARALLGWVPRYSLFDMVDEAVAAQKR